MLDALDEGPLGVTDVADRAALPKSTAARLLATLVGEGAVEQVPGETSYRLGPRLVTLAGGFSLVRSLAAVGRPILADLASSSGEAAGLGVPDGDLVHYIDQVDTPNPVVVRDWTGARAPLHAVSSGQVLLAFRTPAAIERYLAQPTLERFTPARWPMPMPCAIACATSGGAATHGRSRSSMTGSRRSPRPSPTHRVRSSRPSTSTDRRTDSHRRGGRRSWPSWS